MKTYVMNTTTLAVTEYVNYPFNSFAIVFGEPMACCSDGLFQIDSSPTDNGEPVISSVKTGKHSFGSDFNKRTSGVYLTMRAQNDVVVRLGADDDEPFEYIAQTHGVDSLKQRRAKTGRGVAAKHLQIEIEAEGEFELSEFGLDVMASTRRL